MENIVVAVAPLGDVEIETVSNTRSRRSNSGTVVERIQIDFSGKVYGSKRQLNFSTNGVKVYPNSSKKEDPFMKISLNIIFTQMSVTL